MKLRNILLSVFSLCLALGVSAQDNQQQKSKPIASWEKNWYIEVGGGTQLLFSKNANKLLFKDRITSAVSLTAGRWFSPIWGLRLQAQGYAMNGFAVADGTNWMDPVRNHVNVLPDGSYPYHLRYLNMHIDAQFSLANVIWGRDHSRRWDLIPAIGVGYIHTFPFKGSSKNDSYSGHLSLMAKYRLPKGFDINLEVAGTILPDNFDGRHTGKPEGIVGVTAGVSYHFGKICLKKKNRRSASRNAGQMLWDEATLRKIIREEVASQKYDSSAKDTVYVVKEVETKEKEAVKTVQPFVLASIQFKIGDSKPKSGQDMMFQNIANYLNAFPEAKIRIEGYADGSTGSSRQNLRLSMQRAVEVRDILSREYGIDERRLLDVQGIGSDYQPYDKDEWNRVVLIKVIQ